MLIDRGSRVETPADQTPFSTDAPWNTPWPSNGLETVHACPVCGSGARTTLHEGLIDNVFFVAPGKWTLHRCVQCNSAYLSPRPTAKTIHLAYSNYYTHQQTESISPENLHGVRWLQRALANGYRNWHFGTNLKPSSMFGVPAAYLMPANRAKLDREFRHLPRPATRGCLLDVGSGDGSFLENARSAGWDVVGVDPDIEAVKNARQRGLSVYQGGLEAFAELTNRFDVITLSHVIEHMHDPVAALRACHRLLKLGGRIWLETPNIGSLGHLHYKENWRGLETPRHLVLFNPESLSRSLKQVGFSDLKHLPQRNPCDGIFALSQRIKEGRNPQTDTPVPMKLRARIAVTNLTELVLKSRNEFIAITATKR